MTVRAVLIVGVTVWVNSNVAGSVLRAHVPSPDQAGQVPVDAIHQSARRVMEHSDFRSVRRRVLEQVPVQDLDRGFLKGLMNSIGNGFPISSRGWCRLPVPSDQRSIHSLADLRRPAGWPGMESTLSVWQPS